MSIQFLLSTFFNRCHISLVYQIYLWNINYRVKISMARKNCNASIFISLFFFFCTLELTMVSWQGKVLRPISVTLCVHTTFWGYTGTDRDRYLCSVNCRTMHVFTVSMTNITKDHLPVGLSVLSPIAHLNGFAKVATHVVDGGNDPSCTGK